MEETLKFLRSYGKLLDEIKKAKRQKDAAWERATACGGTGSGASHGGGITDKVGVNIAEYERWGNVIHELNVKATAVSDEITRLTDRMREPYGSALFMRYINLYRMEVIAEELGYSLGHTRRLLRRAEEIFNELLFFFKDLRGN